MDASLVRVHKGREPTSNKAFDGKKWAKNGVARPRPEGAGDEVAISRRERV